MRWIWRALALAFGAALLAWRLGSFGCRGASVYFAPPTKAGTVYSPSGREVEPAPPPPPKPARRTRSPRTPPNAGAGFYSPEQGRYIDDAEWRQQAPGQQAPAPGARQVDP